MIERNVVDLSADDVVGLLPVKLPHNIETVRVCDRPHLSPGHLGLVSVRQRPESGDCLQSSPCQHLLSHSGVKVIRESDHYNRTNIRY